MVLTPEQIEALMQVVRDGSTAIAIRTMGHVVTHAEFYRLKAAGYLPEDLQLEDLITQSFELGRHVQRNPKARDWHYAELGAAIKRNPIPLSVPERNAVDLAKRRAGQFCVGLGNTYSSELGRVIVDADQALAERTREAIRNQTSEALERRETVKQLKTRLGTVTQDWSRDWDRIAITETHQAHQEGMVSAIVDAHGDDALMAKICEPNACEACRELFTEGGTPLVRHVSWFQANGTTNVGRKRPDWKAVIGAVHPHCFPSSQRVLTARGEIPIDEVIVGDLVITHMGRWRRVTHRFKHYVAEPLIRFATTSGRCAVSTANHPWLVGADAWLPAEAVRNGDHLTEVTLTQAYDGPAFPLKESGLARILQGFARGGVPITAIYLDGELFRPVHQIDQEAPNDDVQFDGQPASDKLIAKPDLQVRKGAALSTLQALDDCSVTHDLASTCFVSPRNEALTLVGGRELHADLQRFAAAALRDPSLLEALDYGPTCDSQLPRHVQYGEIVAEVQALDDTQEVIDFGRHPAVISSRCAIVNATASVPFAGYVYNLGVDEDHSFVVEGLVTHNCRCQTVRVPAGWAFNADWELVPGGDLAKSLRKAAGPFIGPRGGKWADAEHTIPWRDGSDTQAHTQSDTLLVGEHTAAMHSTIFGEGSKPTTFTVTHADGEATLKPDSWGSSITMPSASVKHFINDLSGTVDVPKGDNAAINSVIDGDAKLLGKGDDGIAFRVGDTVVKVSTTVPYQPTNRGHRTPQDAASMLRSQVEIGNALIKLGVPGLQASTYEEHGDKGFQIKDYVTIPDKLTKEQLDGAYDTIEAMHKHGYVLQDSPQVGITSDGKPVMFDIGKARKLTDDEPKEWMGFGKGMPAGVANDLDNLKAFYARHGATFVSRGTTDGEQLFKLASGVANKKPSKLGVSLLSQAIQKLKAEHASATGDQKARLGSVVDDAEIDLEFAQEDLDAHLAKEAKGAEPADAKVAKSASLVKSATLHARMKVCGFDISIENRKGSLRRWYNRETREHGETKMLHPYGYIRRTEGADGDHVDVFVGPVLQPTHVYVVHQTKAPDYTAWDEDKCMLGWASAEDAKAAYLANYDNPRFFGSMTTMPLEKFRTAVYGAKGKMIKGVTAEWAWAMREARCEPAEFVDVVAKARAGDAGGIARLDTVYAELAKASATESLCVDVGLDTSIVGNMGMQAFQREKKQGLASYVPIRAEPNLKYPLGRAEYAQGKRRQKDPTLMVVKKRFDLRGVKPAEAGWTRPLDGFAGIVSISPEARTVDSQAAHAALLRWQVERQKLRQGSKLSQGDR